MSKMTKQEQAELIRLMNKVSFPLPVEVFYAWSKNFPTVAAELIIIRKGGKVPEIFLTHREDRFYKGWHIPGSIHLPNETFENTLKRVLKHEVNLPEDTKCEYFKWYHYPAGTGEGESPRGDVTSIIFVYEGKAKIKEDATAKFFSLDAIPADLIPIQIPVLREIKQHYGLR